MSDGPAENVVGRSVAASAGAAIGGLFGSVARLRRSKPLHPKGVLLRGQLIRDGHARSGVAWIDAPGEDDVLVRLSRSVGLPSWLPDVQGLALRSGRSDVLLAVTGAPILARHVLVPRFAPGAGIYTSLMPYRGPNGPILLAALPDRSRRLPTDPAAWSVELDADPLRLTMLWATALGAWSPFGHLLVGGPAGHETDPPVRFEPTACPPGLAVYDWVARLRDPAYREARRGFPASAPDLDQHASTGQT